MARVFWVNKVPLKNPCEWNIAELLFGRSIQNAVNINKLAIIRHQLTLKNVSK